MRRSVRSRSRRPRLRAPRLRILANVWALFLLASALGSHAVFVAWLRRALSLGRGATLALAGVAVVLSLALFAPREFFAFTSFELMVVSFGSALFVLLAIVIVAFRKASRALSSRRSRPRDPDAVAPRPAPSDELPGRRDALLGIAGAASFATSGAALGWGAVRGRHDFELVETSVRIPGLPRALDGYVIAQVSDLHVGEFVDDRDLDRGLDLVRRARPDLLVVTGDVVDLDPSVAAMTAARLSALAPRDGVFAILGNHDYYADVATVRRALVRAGIDLLVDDARLVRPRDGGGFRLVGLDDLSAPKYGGRGPDLARALERWPTAPDGRPADRDRPTILLAHQPRQFDEAAGKVALQLSGHTHGLQFDFAARVGRMAQRYVAGRYEKDGSVLWVNRGFGVTGPPSRIGVRPEVTRLVLVSA